MKEDLNDKNRFNPQLKMIMSNMCDRVGVNYDDINFKEDKWYWKHTWTMAQEEEFIKWLSNLLYNDIKVRRAILSYPVKNKKRCEQGARFFASMFGWKLITEDLDQLEETK